MKTYLLFIFTFLAFITYAQSGEKPSQESMTIKMSKYPIADFPKSTTPISGITIMQFVTDSMKLGFAMKGMAGKVVVLKPSRPLTDFLQEQVQRMYKDEYKKKGVKMLWVLKDLHMSERSTQMKYVYTRFAADSYISNDGNLFTKICSVDTTLVEEDDLLSTRSYGYDIENSFRVLLHKTFNTIDQVVAQNAAGENMEEIIAASKLNPMPILSDTSYHEGIYMSFGEFLQNKPSVSNFGLIQVEKDSVKFNNNGRENVWGICQGGEIYKYYEKTLIPIERMGNGFILSNYLENTNRNNRNLFFSRLAAGGVGGVVGGIMAYDASKKSISKQGWVIKTIPYITDPFKQPIASCIDMRTGELSF